MNNLFRSLFSIALVLTLTTTLAQRWMPARAAGVFYVSPGGNDANACTDPTLPCATIQAAIEKSTA